MEKVSQNDDLSCSIIDPAIIFDNNKTARTAIVETTSSL